MLPGSESGQEARHAVAQHLPGHIGSLPIEESAGKGADRTHQESRFWSEGNAGQHNDGKNRLEVGDGNHHTGSNRQSAHHRNGHQMPRLWFASLKGKEERDQDFYDNQGSGEVIPPSRQFHAEMQG